jgi:hypothetical protein
MARYGIALGGNKRNWPMWDNLYASGNTAGDIKYAAHLKVRDYVLPLEFDGQDCDWQAYVEQEVNGGAFVIGDVIATPTGSMRELTSTAWYCTTNVQ